jgi:hypothetical protein
MDDIFGIVEKQHGQWMLEYSLIQTAARSAQPRSDSTATADQWHQRLGHMGLTSLNIFCPCHRS